MELVISIVVGVAICEIYAWLPRISQRLLERAVCRLPAEDQDRYREEWNAYLNDLPNTTVRLVHAFGYNLAAVRVNNDTFRVKLHDIGKQIQSFSDNYYRNVDQIFGIKRSAAGQDPSINLKEQVDKLMASLNAIEVAAGPAGEAVPQAVKAMELFGQALIGATRRHRDLTRVRIDQADARLDQVGTLVRMVAEKYSRIEVLYKRRPFPSRGLVLALDNLTEDLNNLIKINDIPGDDAIAQEQKQIIATIQRATDNLRNRYQ